MKYIPIIFIIAAVFFACWLVDKGFAKLFRSQAQHKSGLSVRLNKRYGSMGLLMIALGAGAFLSGLGESKLLLAGGILILLVGIGLVVYYMATAIFYDEDSFIYTSVRSKSRTYRYNQISHQQLYVVQGGSTIIELHMTDGTAVQVQSNMVGYEEFLNTAFLGWVRQKNIDMRTGGDFHDPSKGCWFPSQEEV